MAKRRGEDRTHWQRGPWDNEPDRADWTSKTGFKCAMRRGGSGAWCGYVMIPVGHPWYRKHYDQIDVDIHGGLTYSDTGVWEVGGDWFIGFDCAHYNDITPTDKAREHSAVYRDMDCVRRWTEDLARQVWEADPFISAVAQAVAAQA